ncbi:MAG: methyltransferase family protein [Leptospirillia bacterium]
MSVPPLPRAPQPWNALEERAYRLRVPLLATPFLIAMIENARHPHPLWEGAYRIAAGSAPIGPLSRHILMLPALCLYAAALTIRLSASASLGSRTVWSGAPVANRIETGGLFGVVRHPLYLGSAGLIVALSMISSPEGAGALLILDLPLLALFARHEEALLSRSLPEFEDYKKSVPAFWPRRPLPDKIFARALRPLDRRGGAALKSEAANVSLLGGFLAFWITPDIKVFWTAAGLSFLIALTAPHWWKKPGDAP